MTRRWLRAEALWYRRERYEWRKAKIIAIVMAPVASALVANLHLKPPYLEWLERRAKKEPR